MSDVKGNELRRLEATVFGRVQGVGFREFVRHHASRRGLAGYVRNSDDGRSVDVIAEGEMPMLDELIVVLREGPRFARVDRVDTRFSEASDGFTRFTVEM